MSVDCDDHRVSRLCVLLSLVMLVAGFLPAGTGVEVWAIDDTVRINPETGKAFEDNPEQLRCRRIPRGS